jgi:hypothetical protein
MMVSRHRGIMLSSSPENAIYKQSNLSYRSPAFNGHLSYAASLFLILCNTFLIKPICPKRPMTSWTAKNVLSPGCTLITGIWPSGQSSRLARRRSRFDSQQGQPLYIWMYTPALWVCFSGAIALYKKPLIYLFILTDLTAIVSGFKVHQATKGSTLFGVFITVPYKRIHAALLLTLFQVTYLWKRPWPQCPWPWTRPHHK